MVVRRQTAHAIALKERVPFAGVLVEACQLEIVPPCVACFAAPRHVAYRCRCPYRGLFKGSHSRWKQDELLQVSRDKVKRTFYLLAKQFIKLLTKSVTAGPVESDPLHNYGSDTGSLLADSASAGMHARAKQECL